jgi:hypothetical protein
MVWMRISYRIEVGKRKERDPSERWGVDERIILKWSESVDWIQLA